MEKFIRIIMIISFVCVIAVSGAKAATVTTSGTLSAGHIVTGAGGTAVQDSGVLYNAIPAANSTFTQPLSGAVSRTQAAKDAEFLTLTDFGVSTSGTQSANTSAAQSAINALSSAGGGKIYIPPGNYPICGLVLASNVYISGAGRNVTVLDGSSCTSGGGILYGPSNAYSLFGTQVTSGIVDWGLKDLTIKGSLSNTNVDCLGTYGYRFNIVSVELSTCGRYGWHTEGGYPISAPMESYVDNLLIDTVNGAGIFNDGPHDSNFDNVIIVDAGQGANNTYAAFYLGTHTNVRAKGFHAWHRSTVTNRVSTALDVEGWGSTFTSSNFEGSAGAPLFLNTGAQMNQFGCDNAYYNTFSAGPLILIRGPSNYICGAAMNNDPGTLPTSSGIQLGDGTSGENVSDNMISLQMTSNNSGAVNFTYDAGGNMIRIIGYQSSGTKYFGTAPASDDIDLVVTGVSGANIHQHP
jgi:hypothetical protein